MKHTLIVVMQDQPGVLNRVVSLFRRRNFNIESPIVGHGETPGVSRMTLVVDGSEVEQVEKQLYRLIEVLKVSDVTHEPVIEREVVLVKVHAPSAVRAELIALAGVYNARVVDVSATSMILEVTAFPSKVEHFIEIMRPYGIQEMMRTGRLAMARGSQAHREPLHADSLAIPA
jgi:acetolactate synthase-1/3 small subunit